MLGYLLCAAALITSYFFSTRSLRAGLYAVLTIGYAYGIVRANVRDSGAYFIFDFALLGLFAGRAGLAVSGRQLNRETKLRQWLWLVAAWPLLLLAIPNQDPWVRLVGFRAQVFFLPFFIFGARLESEDLFGIAKCCALLNLIALGFALTEYSIGIALFYPTTVITEIMYNSHDVVGENFRIPATFSSAHAYAGTLVMTLPFILGAIHQRSTRGGATTLLIGGVFAAAIGTFIAAARVHAAILLVLLLLTSRSLLVRFGGMARLALVVVVVITGLVVADNPRMQRFTLLADTQAVQQRVGVSMNKSLWEYAAEYPLGNGLGGGGTSMPYFLRDRLKDTVSIENQYGTILLELGLPGLLLWTALLVWTVLRGGRVYKGSWNVTQRSARVAVVCYSIAGGIGTGMFTSVPQSCLLMLAMGWLCADDRVGYQSYGEARSVNRPPLGLGRA